MRTEQSGRVLTDRAGGPADPNPQAVSAKGAHPSRGPMSALADKVERYDDPFMVPSDLYREIVRERRLQILCRALAEHEGFDPDEVTDPVTMRLRWRDYVGHVNVLDRTMPSRISTSEMAEALRLKAMACSSDSGSDPKGEDPQGLSAPASQSGHAKTWHRPKPGPSLL